MKNVEAKKKVKKNMPIGKRARLCLLKDLHKTFLVSLYLGV